MNLMKQYLPLFTFVVINGSAHAGDKLKEQNEALFKQIEAVHSLNQKQMDVIKKIFGDSHFISQGNPDVTKHPMTKEQCLENIKNKNVDFANPSFEKICKAKYMAPLYNPKTQKLEDAKTCIDQFEFPNIPCEYPVVWVQADEAVRICQAEGKQLCDAHEWEGACAGELEEPDYNFRLAEKMDAGSAIKTMRQQRNAVVSQKKTWAYGNEFQKGKCGANSTKDAKCNGGNWQNCGSNTYPSGAFTECKSTLGVYDQHGNAAEHMNLPLKKEQMASDPSQQYGHTEMKGSWFIWDKFQAHPDFCRWRAPYWHGSKVMDPKSHHNYHLGFRCCKQL